MINSKKPIGCRSHHFTRKVGIADKCFYCNAMFINGILIHQGNTKVSLIEYLKPKIYKIMDLQLKTQFLISKHKKK